MTPPPLTTAQLLEHIALGEDSQRQFRRTLDDADTLATELVAFANSGGGSLLIGVGDDGSIAALDMAEVRRIHQLLSQTASTQVCPAIELHTHNHATAQGLVIHAIVPDGLSKPYLDKLGRIWVKQGVGKRHVTAREETLRRFQRAGLVYVDVVPVAQTTCADLDEPALRHYLHRHYGAPSDAPPDGGAHPTSHYPQLPLEVVLRQLGLGDGGELNLSGLLLFGREPQRWRPACCIQAIAFPGTSPSDTRYLDRQDIGGTLPQQYTEALAFIKRNLHRVQGEHSVHTPGTLEVAETALQELLVNALVHRDYLVNAPIRVLVLSDRIEIVSPGHLPDGLNLEAVRQGQAHRRNPTLSEHAFRLLPYRGMGSGLAHALQQWPQTELHSEASDHQFRAVLRRPAPQWVQPVALPAPPTARQVTRQDARQDAVQVEGQVARQETRQVTVQVASQVKMQVGVAATGQASGPVGLLLAVAAQGECSRKELMEKLQLKGRDNFEKLYLSPALESGLMARTIPDKPNSRLQKYRITPAGRQRLGGASPDSENRAVAPDSQKT